MRNFNKCSKCGREYSMYSCPFCKEEKPKIEEVKKLPIIILEKSKPLKVLKDNTIKVVKEIKVKSPANVTEDSVQWLPLYTASYLNHKLKYDYNSIKKQTCCVEYKWRYILHSDIIKQFESSLPTK